MVAENIALKRPPMHRIFFEKRKGKTFLFIKHKNLFNLFVDKFYAYQYS